MGTLGEDSEATQPKAVGFQDDTSSVAGSVSVPAKRPRYFKQSDMGYGDGEAWGDDAIREKMRQEQRENNFQNGRGRGRGGFGGGFVQRGGRGGGGGRGGYNNMGGGGAGGYQKRDLRDKSQVTC